MKFLNGINKVVTVAQKGYKYLLIGWAAVKAVQFFYEECQKYLGENGLKEFENEQKSKNGAGSDADTSRAPDSVDAPKNSENENAVQQQ